MAIVRGTVVAGDRRGRLLGFPTANLILADGAAIPDGVFAGTVSVDGGAEHPAAISVGRRPTFYAEPGSRLLEAHLLDFNGDLYGRSVVIDVVCWLRDQMRFETGDHLIAQLHQDVEATRRALCDQPSGSRLDQTPREASDV